MSFEIKEGVRVYYLDSEYEIKKLLDFDTVLAVKLETGVFESIPLRHISSQPISTAPVKDYQDLSQVPKKLLEKANNRLEAISPILDVRSRKLVEERAKEVGISTATLYNWLKAYQSTNRLSSLIFEGTNGGKGKRRLDEQAETILNSVIEEFYLSSQKPTAQKTFELAKLKCKRAGVKPPGIATVRRRIKDVNEKKLLERREGKKSVEHLTPVTSEYPDGNYPLEVIQIDHTRVDIMLSSVTLK